jgi:hypothetical protein
MIVRGGVVEVGDGGRALGRNAKVSLPLPPVMTWLPELPTRMSLFSISVPLVAMMISSPPVPVSVVDDVALFTTVAVAALLVAMPSVLV